jgi:DNA gyrase subunit A
LSEKEVKYYLVTMTENGCIKKMDLEDFLKVPPSGILYTKLAEGDSVKSIAILTDAIDIVVYSHKKALRFDMSQVPYYKRSAVGVSAMSGDDKVDGFSIINKNATHIVVITESGKINKFLVSGLAKKKRNQAGSSVIRLGKNDAIQNIFGLTEDDIVKIYTKADVFEIPVSIIPLGSSISAGQKIISTKSDIIIDSSVK